MRLCFWIQRENGDLWERVYKNLLGRGADRQVKVVKVKGHATPQDTEAGIANPVSPRTSRPVTIIK